MPPEKTQLDAKTLKLLAAVAGSLDFCHGVVWRQIEEVPGLPYRISSRLAKFKLVQRLHRRKTNLNRHSRFLEDMHRGHGMFWLSRTGRSIFGDRLRRRTRQEAIARRLLLVRGENL